MGTPRTCVILALGDDGCSIAWSNRPDEVDMKWDLRPPYNAPGCQPAFLVNRSSGHAPCQGSSNVPELGEYVKHLDYERKIW